MDARIVKGAALLALVVPMVAIGQSSAGAVAADPTYRQYTMPSASNSPGPPVTVKMFCEGDLDNHDTAVGVNGQSFPYQTVPGEIQYEAGRAIGFSSTANFTLICHDDHTAAHDFDLP